MPEEGNDQAVFEYAARCNILRQQRNAALDEVVELNVRLALAAQHITKLEKELEDGGTTD